MASTEGEEGKLVLGKDCFACKEVAQDRMSGEQVFGSLHIYLY
jgi:hypothetical protein